MGVGDVNQIARPVLPTSGDKFADEARRLERAGKHDDAAREMETVFGVMLVRELRRALPNGMFGKGPGADVFEGWFDEHLGKALAARDSLGLSGMVKTSLSAKQAALDEASAQVEQSDSELSPPLPEVQP